MNGEFEGGDILKAFQQMRDLCEDVALLLSTADTFVKDFGWEPYSGNTAVANTSGSLLAPRWWVPWGAFRFYTHQERKHLVAYVCVLFDHPDERDRMKVPLVTAGLFDWGEGNRAGDWTYGQARCHLFNNGRRDDGVPVECGREENAEKGRGFLRMRSVALPLAGIGDANALKERIVDMIFGEGG